MRFPISSSRDYQQSNLLHAPILKEFYDAIQSFNFKISCESATLLREFINNNNIELDSNLVGPIISKLLMCSLDCIIDKNLDEFNLVPDIINRLLVYSKASSGVKLCILQHPNSQSLLLILLTIVTSLLDQLNIILLLYKTHDKNRPYDLTLFDARISYSRTTFNIHSALTQIDSTGSFYHGCRQFLFLLNQNLSTKIKSIKVCKLSTSLVGMPHSNLLEPITIFLDIFGSSVMFIHKSELSSDTHISLPINDVSGYCNFGEMHFNLNIKERGCLAFSLSSESHSEFEYLCSLLKLSKSQLEPKIQQILSKPKDTCKPTKGSTIKPFSLATPPKRYKHHTVINPGVDTDLGQFESTPMAVKNSTSELITPPPTSLVKVDVVAGKFNPSINSMHNLDGPSSTSLTQVFSSSSLSSSSSSLFKNDSEVSSDRQIEQIIKKMQSILVNILFLEKILRRLSKSDKKIIQIINREKDKLFSKAFLLSHKVL